MRIVCLADTHGKHAGLDVPPGDVLVHAGDLTSRGTLAQLADALTWIGSLPHRHKIVVAGNHDFAFQREPVAARALLPAGVTYLEGEPAEVAGLIVWGGPWTPLFAGWAFEENPIAMRGHWASIPDDVELLVTHVPAESTLDQADRGERAGCPLLRRRVAELSRLRLHVHGHIHEARGIAPIRLGQARAVNAACFAGFFARALHPPIVVDLEHPGDRVAPDALAVHRAQRAAEGRTRVRAATKVVMNDHDAVLRRLAE